MKAAGTIINALKRRRARLTGLLQKYNTLAEKLTLEGMPITKLSDDKIGSLMTDDSFWELERMQAREPWSVDPKIRNGIQMYLQLKRAGEECGILEEGFRVYLDYHVIRITRVQMKISLFAKGSIVYSLLLEEAEKSASSIRSLQKHFRSLWKPANEWAERHKKIKQRLEGMLI